MYPRRTHPHVRQRGKNRSGTPEQLHLISPEVVSNQQPP